MGMYLPHTTMSQNITPAQLRNLFHKLYDAQDNVDDAVAKVGQARSDLDALYGRIYRGEEVDRADLNEARRSLELMTQILTSCQKDVASIKNHPAFK